MHALISVICTPFDHGSISCFGHVAAAAESNAALVPQCCIRGASAPSIACAGAIVPAWTKAEPLAILNVRAVIARALLWLPALLLPGFSFGLAGHIPISDLGRRSIDFIIHGHRCVAINEVTDVGNCGL